MIKKAIFVQDVMFVHILENHQMNLQYISDHKGEVAGVFIPISEWEPLRQKLNLPPVDKHSLAKRQHREELMEAFEQMQEIRAGKAPKPSVNDFLREIEAL